MSTIRHRPTAVYTYIKGNNRMIGEVLSQTTPIGMANILGSVITGKRTQLTIAITGSSTILRVGYKKCRNWTEQKMFCLYPHWLRSGVH